MTFVATTGIWATHNDSDLYVQQSAGAGYVQIPDRSFWKGGSWMRSIQATAQRFVCYTRISHGPHLAEVSDEPSPERLQAQFIAHCGAETDEVAWTSASGRKLYFHNEQLVDPRAAAGVQFEMVRPALPFVNALMLDYLLKPRLTWQQEFVAVLSNALRLGGFGNVRPICNGRPTLYSNGDPLPRFYESMGMLWLSDPRESLRELGAHLPDLLLLDCFRKPSLQTLADDIAALLDSSAEVYVMKGRMRESGEALT